MRARFALAQALYQAGRRDEAIAHGRELLRLNPNDNQGVRYLLVHWLLETKRSDDAEALLLASCDGVAAGDRATAIQLAEVLDAFNNGFIGPGHCD